MDECRHVIVTGGGLEISLSPDECPHCLTKQIAALRAELAAYRQALSDIAHGAVGYWNLPEHHNDVIRHFMKIAADAIANKKEVE